MSATGIDCPALTGTAERVRLPAPGSVVMVTARSAFGGESFGSVKPKSAVAKTWGTSSLVATVLSVPDGASLTAATSMVMVFGVGSRSTPPLAVPPSSCTWKVKLA